MKNLAFDSSILAPAPPERVFPLLCPVREYDWIATWRCELVYSTTGVASPDCIFRTGSPGEEPMTWVVSRYEPPRRIEFTCFVPDRFVMRLDIALEPVDADATRLHWSRRFFSLGPEGDRALEGRTEAAERARMQRLESELSHYLRTGTLLR
jgi:hypothetical protein